MSDMTLQRARKGRGAVSNRPGRFEAHDRAAFDDGWQSLAEDADAPPIRTTLTRDTTRTILSRNDSPDVPFDRSVNPYRGCEHGCVYCFARPSHAYWGLSAGLDFESRLFYKPDAPILLDRELRARGYAPRTIALGANTDPYQPVERQLEITRGVLRVLADFRHPVGIVTKSALVLRDLDILAPMAAEGLAKVCVSVTTLDPALARTLEPRAATPPRRLETIRRLTAAGVPVTVLVSPVIPAITDAEIEAILTAAAEAGADRANAILLRLPREIAGLFEEWLDAHYPDRKGRVLSLMRQTRGGRLYDPAFGTRMRGQGPYADLIAQRFEKACTRHGLNRRRWEMRADLFRPPLARGDQLALW
jgi:DNA repair photolyase